MGVSGVQKKIQKPLNCWEFKKCGREIGGARAVDRGVCPAATEKSMDGIHRGDNGGRTCWVVVGVAADTGKQGRFAAELGNCGRCDFYKLVLVEEESELQDAGQLREVLRLVAR